MALTDEFASEQFALKWNNFSYNLSSGFSSYLNNKDLVDVTLAVEGRLLEAHKLVLSVCSPYFENIFKSNPCRHPVVILQDMKYSEVDALVKFMYRGEISVNQEDLARFLKVAEVLKVKGLTLDNTALQNLAGTNSDNPPQNPDEYQQEKVLHNNNVATTNNSNIEKGRNNHKRPHNISARPPKKMKPSPVTLNRKQNITPNDHLSVENPNNMRTNNNEESIDLTQDDDCNNTIAPSTGIVDKSVQEPTDIAPVTYILSARGRPQLVHCGYVYNLTSRSVTLNHSHYRCAEQHRGCRGKCAVIAERFIPTAVSDHNHPPFSR